MTNKERVLRRCPKAHTYLAGAVIAVLRGPVEVKPRGQERPGYILGTGSSYKQAWANAAYNVRRLVRIDSGKASP